jgi:hypothetical protein
MGSGQSVFLLLALLGALLGYQAAAGLDLAARGLLTLLGAEVLAGLLLTSSWGRGRVGNALGLSGKNGQGPCAQLPVALLHSAPLLLFGWLAQAPLSAAALGLATALGALGLGRLPPALQRPFALVLWFLLAIGGQRTLGSLAPFYAPLLFAKVLIGALPDPGRPT